MPIKAIIGLGVIVGLQPESTTGKTGIEATQSRVNRAVEKQLA